MSINLLFSNPQEPVTPINVNTWNAIAGVGSVIAVVGTANEIDAVTAGGTCTLSLPNNVIFPNDATLNNLSASGLVVDVGMYSGTINTTALSFCNPADPLKNPLFEFPVPITSNPPLNELIISNGTGSSNFNTLSSILTNTDNNISISNDSSNNAVINFENTLLVNDNIITNVGTQGNTGGVVSIGANSCSAITNAYQDSFLIGIGANALSSLQSVAGLNQVSVGTYSSTFLDSLSNYNVVVGNQSLADPYNISCNNNVVIGTFAGQSISNGNNNVILGNSSMSVGQSSAVSGVNNNIVIGTGSLDNAGTTSSRNIILGNNVNLDVSGSSNNFIVDPNNITSMEIGNIISGTSSALVIPNMKNPFNVNPSVAGQVLSSDTSGNMSWVSVTGGTSCWIYSEVGSTNVMDGLIIVDGANTQYTSNITLPTSSTVYLPINSDFIFNCYLQCTGTSGLNSVTVTAQLTNISGYTTSQVITGAGNYFLSGVLNTGGVVGAFGILLTFSSILPGPSSCVFSPNSYFTITRV